MIRQRHFTQGFRDYSSGGFPLVVSRIDTNEWGELKMAGETKNFRLAMKDSKGSYEKLVELTGLPEKECRQKVSNEFSKLRAAVKNEDGKSSIEDIAICTRILDLLNRNPFPKGKKGRQVGGRPSYMSDFEAAFAEEFAELDEAEAEEEMAKV